MKKALISLGLGVLLFSGCSAPSKKSAKVIDSAVEGLEYQCAGNIAYTAKDGLMSCYYTPIGFKVGGVKVGIIKKLPADGVVLPQDMVNVDRSDINNDNVKKLTILLQTLDADNNPENGITLKKEDVNKLNLFIDLQKTSLTDFKELISALLEKDVVQEDKAINHLYKSMKKFNIPEANSIDLETLQ